MVMYQLGWFSTGRDKAARDLLETVYIGIGQGDIEAEIAYVFCSREPGESVESDLFLKLVRSYRIPLVYYSYQKFKAAEGTPGIKDEETLPQWRLEYDREVMRWLESFHPDLCILAGYMLVVGAEMCRRYNMINLHPATPGGPAGTWQEVIWQLIDSKAEETGVMMHLITPELDKGPPVAYCTFPIRGNPFDEHWEEIQGHSLAEIRKKQGESNPLFRLIRQHGLDRELPLIVATIKAFANGRVKITAEKKVVDADGRPIIGYNLTSEIDTQLRRAH